MLHMFFWATLCYWIMWLHLNTRYMRWWDIHADLTPREILFGSLAYTWYRLYQSLGIPDEPNVG